MTSVTVAAVDLGASGGRVMAGQVSDSGYLEVDGRTLEVAEVLKFGDDQVLAVDKPAGLAAQPTPGGARVPVVHRVAE